MKILINIEPKYKVKSNSFVLTFFFVSGLKSSSTNRINLWNNRIYM